VEGMDLTNRENVLVADSPQEFARALIELYTSPSLWETISEAGVEKTRAFYSRAAAEKQLRRLFSDDQAEGGPANPSLSGESAALQPLASV
jgi:O-antigen biosynthesis protein